jgi:hypothetical protein
MHLNGVFLQVGKHICLATDWTTGPWMFDPRLWGPPSLLSNGYRVPFPGAKVRSGREADHLPPSSADVENE